MSEDTTDVINNIFDSVFRSMLEQTPQLMIPLINEVFHTKYKPEDLKAQLKNEHKDVEKKLDRTTDSLLHIGNKKYHIECQKAYDNTMVIRMFEYDVAIALQQVREENKKEAFKVKFPDSCILYLTQNKNIENVATMDVEFADGYVHTYKVPVMKAQAYTREEIFQKNLLVLLPYYILRYESKIPKIENNKAEQEKLLREYALIEKNLRDVADANIYTHLIDMTNKILKYEFQNEEFKERMAKVMVGEVFELYSTRMIRQGREQGLEEGREEAHISLLQKLIKNNRMSLEEAFELLEIPEEEQEKYEEKLKESQIQEEVIAVPKQRSRKR